MGSSASTSTVSPEDDEEVGGSSIPVATPVSAPQSTFSRMKKRISGWGRIRLLPSYVDDMKDEGIDLDEDEDGGLLDKFGVGDEKTNWPRACPIIHLDIEHDFELDAEKRLMRRLYNSWIFVFWTLVLNFIGAIAATLTSNVTNPQTVILSFVFAIVQLFIYFLVYFRALYWAMRLRAHTLYVWFYLVSIGWMALFAIIISQDMGLISILSEPLAPGSQLPVKVNPIFPVVVFAIVIALCCYHIFMVFYFFSAGFFWQFVSEKKRKDMLRKQHRSGWLSRWFGGRSGGLLGDADLDDKDFDDPNRPELGKTFPCILHYAPTKEETKSAKKKKPSSSGKVEPIATLDDADEDAEAPPLPVNEVSVPGKVHITDLMLTFEADEPVYDHVFHLNVPLESIATINKSGESSIEIAEKLTDMVPPKFRGDYSTKPPSCLKGPRVERDVMFDFAYSKTRDRFRDHLIKKWKAAGKLAQTGIGKAMMEENRLRLLKQNKQRAEQHLLTHDDWRLLVEKSWQESYSAGQIVIPQNSVLTSLYYVTSGDLVVYLDTSATTASIVDEDVVNSIGGKNVADMNDFKDMGLDSDDEGDGKGRKKVINTLFPSLPSPTTFRPRNQYAQPRKSYYPMGGADEYMVTFQARGAKNGELGLFFRKRRRKSPDVQGMKRIIIVQPPPLGSQADLADVRVGDEIVRVGGFDVESNNVSQHDVGLLIKSARYPLEIVLRRVLDPNAPATGILPTMAITPAITNADSDGHGLVVPGVIVSLDNEKKAKKSAKKNASMLSTPPGIDKQKTIGASPATLKLSEPDLLSQRTISMATGLNGDGLVETIIDDSDDESEQLLNTKTITDTNAFSQETIGSFPDLNSGKKNKLHGLVELEMAETRATNAAAEIGSAGLDEPDSSDEDDIGLENDDLLMNSQKSAEEKQPAEASVSIDVHGSEEDVSLVKDLKKGKRIVPSGSVQSAFGPIKHDTGILQIRNVANNMVASATSFLFGKPTKIRYEKIVDGPIEPSSDDHGDDQLNKRKWTAKDEEAKSSLFGSDAGEAEVDIPTFEEVGQIRTGDIIGLVPWIINHPITVVRIEAKTDVTIQAVSYHHIARVLKERPSFAISFYKYAAATLGERADRDEHVSCKRLLKSSQRVDSVLSGFEVKKLRRLLDDQPIRATSKTEFAERQKRMQRIRHRFQKNRDMEFDFMIDIFDNVIAGVSGMIEMRQKGNSQWEGVDTLQKSGIMEDRGGQLFITNQHICFSSHDKSFSIGRKPKLFGKIHLNDVYEIRSVGAEILLVTDDCRLSLVFSSEETASYAKDLIIFLTDTCSIEVAPFSYTIKGGDDQEDLSDSDEDDKNDEKHEDDSSDDDKGDKTQNASQATSSKQSKHSLKKQKGAGSKAGGAANPLGDNHHVEVFDKLLQVSAEKQAGLREDFFQVVTLLMQVLTPQDKIRLFKGSRSVTLRKNQTIIRANEESSVGAGSGPPGLYLLGGGEVCVQRSVSGRRVQFAKYTEGAIFGIERFLTGSPSPSMIKVNSKIARVRYAPGDRCWLLLKNDPALAGRFYQYATLQYMLRLRGPIITRAVTDGDEIVMENNKMPVNDHEPVSPQSEEKGCVIL